MVPQGCDKRGIGIFEVPSTNNPEDLGEVPTTSISTKLVGQSLIESFQRCCSQLTIQSPEGLVPTSARFPSKTRGEAHFLGLSRMYFVEVRPEPMRCQKVFSISTLLPELSHREVQIFALAEATVDSAGDYRRGSIIIPQ